MDNTAKRIKTNLCGQNIMYLPNRTVKILLRIKYDKNNNLGIGTGLFRPLRPGESNVFKKRKATHKFLFPIAFGN